MADGFLGRWSRRKLDAKEGRALAPEPPPPAPAAAPASASVVPAPASVAIPEAPPAPPPPPTLADAQALTPDADFRRFASADVPHEVKNAALKKLFADPRFNVMDGMDVYIDDYSKPDPIPAAMLRQLASAQFLGLFEEKVSAAQPRDDADRPGVPSVAQSAPPSDSPSSASPPPAAPPTDNADPNLRLQPDHAPPGERPGDGTG